MNRRTRLLRYGLFTAVAALMASVLPPSAVAVAVDPCGSGTNAIVCENSKAGTPMSDWFAPSAYGDIKGFSAQTSVQSGDTVQFKIQSPTPYKVSVYRLGHYGGDGARLMSTAAQAAQVRPANFAPGATRRAAPPSPPPGWSTAATGPSPRRGRSRSTPYRACT